ncbi:MAG: UDP-N-acetylglucosamine--N-acetylmuramyl-(pentapeptide) pyrophosphoryl-undecaprenol N-acetylglucosamine transferase [Acidobacteriota bacterium]
MNGATILIAGGGTGGHVYPAIAIGAELARRGHAPVFAGTARGLEARIVPEHGYPLELVRVRGIRGRGIAGLLTALALPVAVMDALSILRRRRPAAVVGVGGYASGPCVALAAALGKPTLIEEQNVVAGATNRILGRIAGDVALPSEEARASFGGRGFVAGVPVRAEFFGVKKNRGAVDRSVSSSSAEARGLTC